MPLSLPHLNARPGPARQEAVPVVGVLRVHDVGRAQASWERLPCMPLRAQEALPDLQRGQVAAGCCSACTVPIDYTRALHKEISKH